jgi:hypothetical protein
MIEINIIISKTVVFLMNWRWGLLAIGMIIAAIGLTLMITGVELFLGWPISQNVFQDITYIGIILLVIGIAIAILIVFVEPKK